jgi:hypothetical protein
MQLGFARHGVLAVAIAVSAPALAAGQNQDTSFRGLAQSLRPQSHVLVMDRAGNEVFGRVEAVSDTSLIVVTLRREERPKGAALLETGKRTFTPADVASIAQSDSDGRRGREIYLSTTAFGARMRELKPGRKVTVVRMDTSWINGRVQQVRPSTIVIDPGDGPAQTFGIAEIFELRQRDELWDGPLYWALAPATAGVLAQFDEHDNSELHHWLAAVGICALIGLGIDAARKPAVYYRSPAPRKSTEFSIAPVLTNKRRGVMAVLRF